MQSTDSTEHNLVHICVAKGFNTIEMHKDNNNYNCSSCTLQPSRTHGYQGLCGILMYKLEYARASAMSAPELLTFLGSVADLGVGVIGLKLGLVITAL